jgi:hypothetical protein
MTLAHVQAAGISRESMRSDSEWLVPKIGVGSGYLVRRLVSFFGAGCGPSTLFNQILIEKPNQLVPRFPGRTLICLT